MAKRALEPFRILQKEIGDSNGQQALCVLWFAVCPFLFCLWGSNQTTLLKSNYSLRKWMIWNWVSFFLGDMFGFQARDFQSFFLRNTKRFNCNCRGDYIFWHDVWRPRPPSIFDGETFHHGKLCQGLFQLLVLGMSMPTLIGNPYDRYINPGMHHDQKSGWLFYHRCYNCHLAARIACWLEKTSGIPKSPYSGRLARSEFPGTF